MRSIFNHLLTLNPFAMTNRLLTLKWPFKCLKISDEEEAAMQRGRGLFFRNVLVIRSFSATVTQITFNI